MKQTEVKVLTDLRDKIRTRELYQDIFNEDSDAFVSFYYEDRCRDNKIVISEQDEHILSMAHINPYHMMVKGKNVKIYYIYAVATDRAHRHEGHMREVLECAFREMQEEDIPFCFLIPVDEKIYEPFGFETIAEYQTDRHPDPETLQKQYDVYCVRDEDYQRRLQEEERIAMLAGEGDGLPEHPVIMAKVISKEAFAKLSGLTVNTQPEQMLAWLREQKIYISEDI